jgi:hypothetical protein
VVARAAGWGCDLGGQPRFEFSRVIDRSRDTLGRSSGWQLGKYRLYFTAIGAERNRNAVEIAGSKWPA